MTYSIKRMTRADLLLEYYGLVLMRLQRESHECRARRDDHEPEPQWRVQMCAARRLDQIERAQAAGLFERLAEVPIDV